ncbi:hypothetical protein RUM44_012165 [Polyplax serrata]|uniref:Galectin n=1 Tax=Polyplax serrata TaxID=468196 RepID=A0ABR1BAJ1_POLSC
MQICSPCFPKSAAVPDVDGPTYSSICCKKEAEEADEVDLQTRFYCCGRVPSKEPFKKRHGMCEFQDLNDENSVETAIEAFDYTNLGDVNIVDPHSPFNEYLPEELYQGRTIEVRGKLQENARRFSINLSTGKTDDADLALHFNPRFDRRLIIRNHRIKNKWGVEEILALQHFPFKTGRNFSVLIFVADEQFFISVNRMHYCAFTFRIPVEKVKCLIIVGDVQLERVRHGIETFYPPQNLKKTPKIVIPQSLKKEHGRCDIRRKNKTITVGTKIDIFGRLKLLPSAFYVNLQKGVALWPHPIIPFHMNLRFYPPGTHKREKEIIFNNWKNGFWGKEEIISYCPFLPGTSFHIQITCQTNGYKVVVNEKMLFNYNKTTVDSDVDSVVVHGDIVITKVIIR